MHVHHQLVNISLMGGKTSSIMWSIEMYTESLDNVMGRMLFERRMRRM